MSLPQSNIQLCRGVRLSNRFDHSILFPDKAAQLAYFRKKVDRAISGYVYIRKNWTLQVEASMGEASRWSYLYFTNPDDSHRYFYFVTDVQYVNDRLVDLQLELDVVQTYMFDWSLLATMVEREHSATDRWGENTVDEGLDVGEYIVNGTPKKCTDLNELAIMILCTYDLQTTTNKNNMKRITCNHDGVFSGLGVFAVQMSEWTAWAEKLALLDGEGISDGIVSMWMYPKKMLVLATGESWGSGVLCKKLNGSAVLTFSVPIPGTLDGYTPKNNKLLQYPYNLLYLTNNNGGSAVYRPEQFSRTMGLKPDNATFSLAGTVGADASIKAYPNQYKGAAGEYEEGLSLANFPTCAWNTDTFALWLAQNQGVNNTTALINAGQVVAGVALLAASGFTAGMTSAGGAGLIVSGLTGAMQQNAQIKDAQTQPPAAKGSHSSSVNVSVNNQTFTAYPKSVDAYHARRLDDFFTMYGYKTMQVKVPSLNTRPHFNYIKTIGETVTGDIPQADLQKLNELFNRGLTFWHDGDEVGDYSVDNRP